MLEGFWINYTRGWWANIGDKGDHAQWLSDRDNARSIGLPETVIDEICLLDPAGDRTMLISSVLTTSSLMRIRGHREYVTCEFASEDETAPLKAILEWGSYIDLGPQTRLHVVNFNDMGIRDITWAAFRRSPM